MAHFINNITKLAIYLSTASEHDISDTVLDLFFMQAVNIDISVD